MHRYAAVAESVLARDSIFLVR